MRSMTCSATQFAAFRMALGLFLLSHFLWLLPYAGELYGPAGMYASTLKTPFPNLLSRLQSSGQTQIFMGVLAVLAALLMAGIGRRWSALLLWYGWACLTNWTPLLYVPSEGLVGWLLLLCALIPSGEAWSLWPRASKGWMMPNGAIQAVWIVLGVGYLASGVDKLTSPSWRDGSAVRTVLNSPIAYWDFVASGARQLPDSLIRPLSWFVLMLEVGYFWHIWRRWTRPLAWAAATAMHITIRATLNLHTVTDPFLVAQILTFDVSWFLSRSENRLPS